MTTTEVAVHLGIKPRSVTALVQRGLIKAEKAGGNYLITAAALEAYKANRRKIGRPPKRDPQEREKRRKRDLKRTDSSI